MQLVLQISALVATSTAGGGLFSSEELPDAPAGGLFSSEGLPDAPEAGLFAAEAPVAEPPFEPKIRASLFFEAVSAVDTSFDRKGENVFELSLLGRATVDSDFARDFTIYVSPSFNHVTAVSREGDDRQFTYLEMPEAHVTWSFAPRSYLRVGTQVFNWGTSDFAAPADVLNPVDLRRGLLNTSNPSATKIPVLAAEVVTGVGPLTLRGVVQPIFTSSRFFLSGWDDAIGNIAGATGFALPDLSSLISNTTLDRTLDQLLITERPADRPDNATLGARATVNLGDLDLSASVVYGWESLPRLSFEPALLVLATKFGNAFATGPPIDRFDPELFRAFDALDLAIQQGRNLISGKYLRRTLIGIDGAWALDPIVLKLDVAFTFERTLYTQDFRPVSRPWLNATLGAEYAHGDTFQVLGELFALTVFDVRSNERLQIIEPVAPPPSQIDEAGRTIAMPGAILVFRYSALEGDLAVDAAVVSTLTRGDFFFAPNIRYKISDAHSVSLGGLLVEGKSDGYGGLTTNNDRVHVGYKWSM